MQPWVPEVTRRPELFGQDKQVPRARALPSNYYLETLLIQGDVRESNKHNINLNPIILLIVLGHLLDAPWPLRRRLWVKPRSGGSREAQLLDSGGVGRSCTIVDRARPDS